MFDAHPRHDDRALEEEWGAVLALTAAAGDECHRAAVVIEVIGSALRLLEGDRTGLDPWEAAYADELARTVGDADVQRGRAIVAEQAQRGVSVLTVLDTAYPTNLRMVHNLPPALFVKGALPAGRRVGAIVGSRRPSTEGARWAAELADALVTHGMVVVSDFSAGVASAAHQSALAAGGPAIAVVSTGTERPGASQSEQLADAIASNGAVVSPSMPGTPPSRGLVRMRWAVVSGLAAAVVVIEGARGDAVARVGIGQGRPVFLVEGLSSREQWARQYLARDLVTVVSSVAEVVECAQSLTGSAA